MLDKPRNNLLKSLPFYHLDDYTFKIVLNEIANGSLNYDFESLESLLFNPTDQARCKSSFNSHLNPDSNFPFCPPESDYLVEEEINARIASKKNKASFSFLHLNACSLARHFDNFKMLLSKLSVSFPVIGVTETCLSDLTTDSVDISGFKFLSNHCTNKNCGGTGLYLQDNLEYKLHPDCNYSDPEVIESLFVELDIPRGKNIVVGVVYRLPNQNLSAFLAVFNEILSNITRGGKTYYVAGHYNLDILHHNDHAQTQEFVNNLFLHMLFPLITKPTCITANSATLIDNIFTNHLTADICNGIIINDISDHLPIFAHVFDRDFKVNDTSTKILKCKINETTLAHFRVSLGN